MEASGNSSILAGTLINLKASLGGRTAICEFYVLNCGGNGIAMDKWMGIKNYPSHGYGPRCFAVRSSDEGTYDARYWQHKPAYNNTWCILYMGSGNTAR